MEGWVTAIAAVFQMVAAWLSALITAVLVVITGYYAWETRKARQTARDTLTQLQTQNEKMFDTHVVPIAWKRGVGVSLSNLGPGAAINIEVQGAFKHNGQITYVHCMLGGLAVGGRENVQLHFVEGPFDDLPDVLDGQLSIKVSPQTVLRKQMTGWVTRVLETNVS